MKLSFWLKIFLFFFCFVGKQNILLAQFASQSILANGEWYKIGITKTGMYKLDANFLKQAGLSLSGLNPQNIHLYGNGGGMLPQANNASRIDDLRENAIWIQGENDGKFDDVDYIVFYAQNSDKWSYNAVNQLFEREKNIYTDTTFYYLTFNNTAGLRVQNQASVVGASTTFSTFDDYTFLEVEKDNILKSGREWYGDAFVDKTDRVYTLDLKGIANNSNLKITSAVMAKDFNPSNFQLSVNNTVIGSQGIPEVGTGTYDLKGMDVSNSFSINSITFNNTESLPITLRYNSGTGNGSAYLNYLTINYLRNLKLQGNQTIFRVLASLQQGISNFNVSDMNPQALIWEITNLYLPQNQAFSLNNTQAVFGANTNNLKEFVAFNPSNLENPSNIRKINNQNLHALSPPNLLIISPSAFLSEAQRLANFRQSHDNLSVVIVSPEQIYNEFSSGKQDISAIRDFVRSLYLKDNENFKYLLLFGAASFDYKNRIPNNTNFIPIYESRQSLHPIYSFSSDDYYGLLEAGEGDWQENDDDEESLEIGIGRLPVSNLTEAKNVVNKLIYYSSNLKTLGKWRNQISFVADDGDGNTHQIHADELAETVEKNYPLYNPKKMYLDAFEQTSTGSGELCPSLHQAISDAVNQGIFILNYTGHGGEIGWTEEKILDIPQIRSWRNLANMPLFVTATCEFGRYDNPYEVSGAEEVLLNARGGGIGLITTTRPVFSSTNLVLNRSFYQSVFQPINGQMPRLGDVIRKTKNLSQSGVVNRNFSLLGDPSLRLAYPQAQIAVTKINGKDFTASADTLKALRKITLEGEIQSQNQAVLSNFKGTLYLEVFDKRETLQTKGTAAGVMSYKDRNIRLFKGSASVQNGQFSISFIVPKDINYQYGKGKINLYALDTTLVLDAAGILDQIVIGGSDNQGLSDNTPPEIKVWMNDENFKSGNEIQKDAVLLAKLKDANGINISEAGLGHEITAILQKIGKEDSSLVLNQYYQANLNNYGEGYLQYPLKNLEKGKYQLTLQAWDTYNNSAQASIEFIVAENAVLALYNVFNFPNPVYDHTTFRFNHNQENQDLDIKIEIINSEGKLVKTLTTHYSEATNPLELNWNGVDEWGRQIGKGLFLYRITVMTSDTKVIGSVVKKLIIIN